MQWVLWMIAVAVLGLAAVAASGRLGELPGTVTNTPRPHLPPGVMTGEDLRGIRFAVAPRGYSMDQVDELLDRLSRQLDAVPPGSSVAPGTRPSADPGVSPSADPGVPLAEGDALEPGAGDPPPWSREAGGQRA
ncbi:MAG: DivIVA domain-containing protein [Micropruina sp.]|uniref:DivIVA domain-containing protein n=1 Tax=Micropruina sp. TaxID=2737536 RepID=UPI0039E46241